MAAGDHSQTTPVQCFHVFMWCYSTQIASACAILIPVGVLIVVWLLLYPSDV